MPLARTRTHTRERGRARATPLRYRHNIIYIICVLSFYVYIPNTRYTTALYRSRRAAADTSERANAGDGGGGRGVLQQPPNLTFAGIPLTRHRDAPPRRRGRRRRRRRRRDGFRGSRFSAIARVAVAHYSAV